MKARTGRFEMAEIAREHYSAVYRFCVRRVGVDRAADVAQETFLTAQKALPKFRGESSLSTWLFGIAHNECRRASRQSRGEPMPLELDESLIGASGGENALVDREAIRTALARLTQEHREVVLMHEIEGMTYDEIAVVLSVPAGTVKSRLHHAFLNLRKVLCPTEEVR